ncbi:MAG TPA: DUF1549 domain-containing protein, partial [Bryobacteraceae bacterium]|nr:DUF1549 domain-containing protein [Bryobacteraceae bacterium]
MPVSAEEKRVTAADCNFSLHPDEFLQSQSRVRMGVHRKTQQLDRLAAAVQNLDPASVARRNFIDEEIFSKLEKSNVRSAPLATDEEFLRRVMLDLTGRIPSPADVRGFVSNPDPGKRSGMIDQLLKSPEFTDKWAWWMSDLLQVNAAASNVNRGINGRNAFYAWIRAKVSEDSSLKDIAYQCVTGSGNSYLMEEGASNYVINSITPMGPSQDQYDTMFSRSASTFLGMGYYDCILCHNGRGRLDALS